MYEINPVPNSDQKICSNCETIVGEKMITETIKGESGCTECISRCGWCGHYYFSHDMFDDPYLGYCCDACLSAEDYMNASEAEITKDALAGLFFSTESKEIEDLVIKLVIKKGYFELANDLKNDKS